MRFLAPLMLILAAVAVACCGNPPKHVLPIGDNDPEVVFETQLITAYPDPRRNPPAPAKAQKARKNAVARKEPQPFK